MRETFLFGWMEKIRERMLLQVENCPEDKRNVVPDGFNNSILWQLGHILTVMDRLVFGFSGEIPSIPSSYQTFFGNGTKPADWTEEPPSWETITAQLKEQQNRVRTFFTGKCNTVRCLGY